MTKQADMIVHAAHTLFANEVMSHSGHANLSARLDDERMLLTIDGQVRNLTSERVATVALDGTVLEGELDPTNAEIIAMHTEIYKLRPAVGGIIHTHSPNLLAFAMANVVLPCRYEALLRWGQAVDVPVAPWAPRGSAKSVSAIIDQVKAHPDTNAVILGNHGVLVFASDPLATAQLLTVLEEAAEAELAAVSLGGASSLPETALEAIRESMARVR
ncbi:class II aldolase/adducin family protein [Ferrimicrobium acidiphilum]|uniref:L-ribulose-5-phosphate 4-epimerase UlaF n=1 Tax=Ferrimicrobium acidiphilum DSM 19497 TaxID=1121877 RepID=A0A0D8FSC0_9ACTN|nr:class II aldolase/adducin family protein [Ferrimicrobium acidiphilum]KJE76026.1 L-ribulose-5-phosphate 4-epimerase UlaF [Ferrimicrobium acidiphilum DSM 19497]